MKVLGVDPGGTTGVCLLDIPDDAPAQVLWMDEVGGGTEGFLSWAFPTEFDALVCESFHLDGRTPKPDLTPVEIIGALKAMGMLQHTELTVADILRPFSGNSVHDLSSVEIKGALMTLEAPPALAIWDLHFQTNTQGKHLMTNEVLKRAGYYPKRGSVGGGHAVDALRHALTFCVKQLNHRPTINKLWPKEES